MPSLPDLPTELLMEIIKYVEPVQWYRYRDIRRALSQTCRTLRPIFLGSFWSAATVAFRTETVERQLSRVQKLPYLLPYIRSLSVSMEGCTMESWQLIAQLLRVLQLLSHLQTLAIERFPHTMIDVLAISCHRIVFPSILILALPAELSPILHCFPNVHTLTPLTHSLVTVAAQCCEHIHTVNLINTAADCKYAEGYRRVTKCIRETIPGLQRLSIQYPEWGGTEFVDVLRLLEGMGNLRELRILLVWGRVDTSKLVEVAKGVLRTSKASVHKELRVQRQATSYHDVLTESSETRAIMNGGQWSIITHSPIPSDYGRDWCWSHN